MSCAVSYTRPHPHDYHLPQFLIFRPAVLVWSRMARRRLHKCVSWFSHGLVFMPFLINSASHTCHVLPAALGLIPRIVKVKSCDPWKGAHGCPPISPARVRHRTCGQMQMHNAQRNDASHAVTRLSHKLWNWKMLKEHIRITARCREICSWEYNYRVLLKIVYLLKSDCDILELKITRCSEGQWTKRKVLRTDYGT